MYAKLQDMMSRKNRSQLHGFIQNANVEEVSQKGIILFYFQ